MTTIEITVKTLDELVQQPEKIIEGIGDTYWNQGLADEDLSIVIRGNASHVTAEDALASFQESYSQHFTEKYERWQGANPWKAALGELFDFRTDGKRKLSKQVMIGGLALLLGLGRYPNGPLNPVAGAVTGGALEGLAYLESSGACRMKEQFYYDLMNASIAVEEVTVRKVV